MTCLQQTHHDLDWAMRAVHMHRAVLILDRSGRIVAINEVCLSMCGYRRQELIGRPVGLLLDPQESCANSFLCALDQAGGEPVQIRQMAQVNKFGRRFLVEALICPIRDQDNQHCLTVLFLREPADNSPMPAFLCAQPAQSAQIIQLPTRSPQAPDSPDRGARHLS